ncbi:MAG TPA: PDZ domain-containing protein [Acidimicrobiales bacterium]|nr:PDZ domain-containing protein [Acidimicrobiales bacterium]
MDSGGPSPEPGEPEEVDDAPLRGWIPPDDRLWRHPSELGTSGDADPVAGGSRRERSTVLAVGAVGAVVVVVAVAAAAALSGGITPGARETATVTSVTTAAPLQGGSVTGGSSSNVPSVTNPAVTAMVNALRPSLVAVMASDRTTSSTSGATAVLTGVVMPGGRLVITAASAVVGMRDVDVVTVDGRHHHGTVAGADERSGVAVVSVDDALAPATFADDDVAAGAIGITACLCGADAHTDATGGTPTVSVGVVRRSGQSAALSDGTTLVDTIEASVSLDPGSWGTVLLDSQGQVAGILDSEQDAGGGTIGVFVPAPLALDVAGALASAPLVHGWLGIVCTDSPTSASNGPVVTTVFADSPAAHAGVEVGDVIQAVDGHAVATIAQLQARLYALTPGTAAGLTVVRGVRTMTVPVTLATEPG